MSAWNGERQNHRPSPTARWAFLTVLLALLALSGCGHDGPSSEEGRVKVAFAACKAALVNQQTDQAMAYVPNNVRAYLTQLNAAPPATITPAPGTAPVAKPNATPGVDLLLRTALERKVPKDLRTGLTFDLLMHRIAEKRLLNPRDVREIELGRISVTGDRASAELYYEGTLTALHLSFLKEDNAWKIDVLAILPYAEVLMRLDRAIKGETEAQQVEQLVSKLPSL